MLQRPQPRRKVVACLNLTGCPVGEVLSKIAPNPEIDEVYLSGWENPLTPIAYWNIPSNMRVIEENGNRVIEFFTTTDRCLMTGNPLWQDYIVEAQLRQMSAEAVSSPDNDVSVAARTGIVFRYQNLRQYYLYCLEDLKRLALYRRADDDWHVLKAQEMEIDPERYYTLKVELSCQRIRCFLDGERVFEVTDYAFAKGHTGVRACTPSRLRSVEVTMTEGEQRIYIQARDRQERELDELRERYAKPVLWKRMDLRHLWPYSLAWAPLTSNLPRDMIIFSHPSEKGTTRLPKIVAMTLDGDVLWEQPLQMVIPMIGDPTPEGEVEIIGVVNEQLTKIDAKTGKITCQTPLPHEIDDAHRLEFNTGHNANLRGSDSPCDIIFRFTDRTAGGSGDELFAYDENLNLLWSRKVYPRFGHGFSVVFCDIDGDGRDEILAGGSLINGDGELLWQMEGADEITHWYGGHHVDAVAMGHFASDPDVDPVAFIVAGSAGVYVLDALTGRIRDVHRVGHAQGRSVGNFRPELDGIEVLVGTRWWNYGILNIFSGRGDRLQTFEPDNISQGGPPVNWSGDGQEFFLLATSAKALGLWDGYGRKVVLMPQNRALNISFYGRAGYAQALDLTADPRDELVFISGGELCIFTQDRSLLSAKKVYAPIRRHGMSFPRWSKL